MRPWISPSSVAIVAGGLTLTATLLLLPHDQLSDHHESLLACEPVERVKILALDVLCSLMDPSLVVFNSTDDTQPLNEVSPLVEYVVTLFLLCGECVVLGAALFGAMVHATPGHGLHTTPQAAQASLLGISCAIAYQVVILGWYLGWVDVWLVVWAAPACQALLTVAVALLYAAVATYDNSRGGSLRPRQARFC